MLKNTGLAKVIISNKKRWMLVFLSSSLWEIIHMCFQNKIGFQGAILGFEIYYSYFGLNFLWDVVDLWQIISLRAFNERWFALSSCSTVIRPRQPAFSPSRRQSPQSLLTPSEGVREWNSSLQHPQGTWRATRCATSEPRNSSSFLILWSIKLLITSYTISPHFQTHSTKKKSF